MICIFNTMDADALAHCITTPSRIIVKNIQDPDSLIFMIVCILMMSVSEKMVLCWNRALYDTGDMMTSSNGNIFHVTGHLCGEFTGPGEFTAQKPVTRSFDVFFDLRLN